MRGILTGWSFVWLVGCTWGWAAPPDADLVELIRFYNHRINEHAYAYLPRELGEWRQVDFVKEHHSLGRVATRQLPGTVRLLRMFRKSDRRHFYSFSPIEPQDQYEIDQVNFNVFVWKSPGDGRIPVYVSTWIDRSDVFLEGELKNVEQFSLDSKKALNVERLRPTSGAYFYVYPSGKGASDQANLSSPEPLAKTAPSPPSIEPAPIPTQAAGLPAVDRIQFEAMELKHPATGMTISENGRWLFIAHQHANLITVYDVVEQSVLTEIACPAPRSIVSRGSRLFVGNFGHGTVSVIDRENSWKIEKKIRLPKLKIQHLSAPQGDYFDGHVLVTCHGEDSNAASNDSHNIWLDVNGQEKPDISKAAIAFVSADRRTVLLKDHYGYKVRFLSEVLQLGDKATDLYRGGESQDALVHQVAPGGYWFGTDMIMGGVPIQHLPLDSARMIIPDHSQPLFYAMDDSHLRARRLATTFPQLAEREVVWPAEFTDKSQIFRHLDRLRSFQFTPPVAWTHGQDLYLFVLTAEREQLLRAKTRAFQASPKPTYDTPAAQALAQLIQGSSANARVNAVAKAGSGPVKPGDQLSGASRFSQGFPKAIPAGKEFRHRWTLPPGASLELLSDLPGAKVSSGGELRWTPRIEQLGQFEFKLRLTTGNQIQVERLVLEVADPELLASLGGDLSKFDTAQRMDLSPGEFHLSNSTSNQKVMLLQGDQLTVLEANGFGNPRKRPLPKRYRMLADRREYLVALAQDECSLDLIDKATLKINKSIALERPEGKVDSGVDLALDPTSRITYVTVRHENLSPRNSIIKIDEVTGRLTPMNAFGTWVAVSPDGRRIFTGHRDIFQRGSSFHINPNWSLIEIPRYGSIDILMTWDPTDQGSILQAQTAPGANGQGVRLAPDGGRVIYLSYTGDPGFPNDLVGWNTLDFDKDPVRYQTKDIGSTTELAFHPWMPILAVPGTGAAILFDQDTGKQLDNMLLMPSTGLGEDKIERLHFSVDGKYLLVVGSRAESRYLRAIKLRIPPQELQKPKRGPVSFELSEVKPMPLKKPIDPREFAAFRREVNAQALTPKEIGRKYLDSVVTIKTNSGSGSGFFIGPAGYLLTSAHVVEDVQRITVIHNKAAAGKPFEAEESVAELLTRDVRLDIALLKIDTKVPLTIVRFAAEESVETGEPVTVIGNPGAGKSILTRTMTNGIVSNAEREISGVPYIQTSAAINPGNSGGPMFDSRGHVIGMINLKARIEGAAFALPTKTIRQYLKDVTGYKEPQKK